MKKYTLTVHDDGTGVLSESYYNPDKSLKALEEKPYLFEVGMKVVDPFGNTVTISDVHKRPSINSRAPQWTLNVEENGNTYVYYEIIGILVRDNIPVEEVNSILCVG